MRLEVPQADNAEARREGATNHIAGGGSSNNFNGLQRRNTRFPANFIADRAEEDDGGEAFQHSSVVEGPAPAPHGSCTAAAYRKASQYCEDNPRPPRYTPLNRSRLPRGRRRKRQHK